MDLAYLGPAAQQGSNVLDTIPGVSDREIKRVSDAATCIGSDTTPIREMDSQSQAASPTPPAA